MMSSRGRGQKSCCRYPHSWSSLPTLAYRVTGQGILHCPKNSLGLLSCLPLDEPSQIWWAASVLSSGLLSKMWICFPEVTVLKAFHSHTPDAAKRDMITRKWVSLEQSPTPRLQTCEGWVLPDPPRATSSLRPPWSSITGGGREGIKYRILYHKFHMANGFSRNVFTNFCQTLGSLTHLWLHLVNDKNVVNYPICVYTNRYNQSETIKT